MVEVGVAKQKIYGTYYVKFKHIYTSDSDVTVYFANSEATSVEKLTPGLAVEYSGTIVSSGFANNNHRLKSGKIIEGDSSF